MPKYAIVVDVEKCTGCYSCFLACKDEHVGNNYLPITAAQPEKGHTWLRLKEIEHGGGTKLKVDYIPIMCQHCEEPVCALKAPAGAVYRREDGIVIIDPEKAKGCKEIVNTCPYRVIYWNEKQNVPQKCTMCAHMMDKGEKTVRCAEVCPTGALIFGDLSDPDSDISKIIVTKAAKIESFKDDFDTHPTVKYIGLPKPFIAGEVLLSDKLNDCAKNVKVTLTTEGADCPVRETKTDFFGDFEFKRLNRNTNYIIKVEQEGYFPAEISVHTYASQNLGEIVLKAK